MPSLVVKDLDESIVNTLKERVVKHHCSTEAEHRTILAEVLMRPQRKSFAEALASIPAVGDDTDFLRINDDDISVIQIPLERWTQDLACRMW